MSFLLQDEDVPLSTEDKRDSSHSNEADPVGSMPPIAKSIFDVMIDMAKVWLQHLH